MILRWALHFASGNSLFSGVALLLVVWGVVTFVRPQRFVRVLRLPLSLGIVLIALSATPLPWWVYAIWFACLSLWIPEIGSRSEITGRMHRVFQTGGSVMVLVSLLIVAFEVATLFPRTPSGEHGTMYVIGDSITAGLNEDDLLWPTILTTSEGVKVINLAQPGAMADSALKQAQQIPDSAEGIILIEIGGNDLLSGKPAATFGAELKSLIESLAAPNRTLVMMELPLAPFKNEYGRIQRELADDYNIVLISKREFAQVLGTADGTLDGIHLSPTGQRLMAEIIWKYVAPLYQKEPRHVAGKQSKET